MVSSDRIRGGPTRSGKARYGISIVWTWSAASRVRDSQVQSYPYKHIRDIYVTLGWISTDAFLAPQVKACKF